MAPKLAAMDTWRPHATVRIGLAVPGRPIGPWSRRTGAPKASATGRDRPPMLTRLLTGRAATPRDERVQGWDDASASAQLEGVVEARKEPASTPRGQFRF